MRYKFILAITNNLINEENKVVTPMIGYILYDNQTNKEMAYSRKESYDLINEFGAENVEAKSRIDGNGNTCYYLKLKDKSIKINQLLKYYKEIAFEPTSSFSEVLKKLEE